MPQKKTTRKNSGNTARKNTAKRTSKNTRTTRTSRSPRRTSKKPKVYIPAYKAIIFCCTIITICMGLLLFTTLREPNKNLSDEVIARYKEEIVDSKKQKSEESKTEE